MASNVVTQRGEMPYRKLGRTAESVSCIGLGGFHLGLSRLEEADAIRLFQRAIERGVNFSDNSWDYNQGESERRVGKALKGRRDKVFVMSKFDYDLSSANQNSVQLLREAYIIRAVHVRVRVEGR